MREGEVETGEGEGEKVEGEEVELEGEEEKLEGEEETLECSGLSPRHRGRNSNLRGMCCIWV